MYNSLKQRTRAVLELATEGGRLSRAADIFLVVLIVLNVLAVILETVDSVSSRMPRLFEMFELISVAIFTVEYLLRVWSCTAGANYPRPILGRLRFVLTPLLLVDLVALLPAYLPAVIALDLRSLRAVRLFRFVRLLKIARYSESLRTMGRVFAAKRAELGITLFGVAILLVLASTLIYFAEHGTQPEVFSSIPAAMRWGVCTLTTVGYGDVYPVTMSGKAIGTIIAILGVGLFALPAGILGSGFMEEVEKRKQRHPYVCPHCGHAPAD